MEIKADTQKAIMESCLEVIATQIDTLKKIGYEVVSRAVSNGYSTLRISEKINVEGCQTIPIKTLGWFNNIEDIPEKHRQSHIDAGYKQP